MRPPLLIKTTKMAGLEGVEDPFPFMGNLWFVFALSFNVYLWHAQTINFHGMRNKYLNEKQILCTESRNSV